MTGASKSIYLNLNCNKFSSKTTDSTKKSNHNARLTVGTKEASCLREGASQTNQFIEKRQRSRKTAELFQLCCPR